MTKNREIKISQFLSYVLRHKPESIALTLNKNGWASVADILNNSKLSFSVEELKQVVENNDKKRFSFNDDLTQIKANQGHSAKVELAFQEVIPPETLYNFFRIFGFRLHSTDPTKKNEIRHIIQRATNHG